VDIGVLVKAFWSDLRVQALVWLIVVHTLIRIAAAIKAAEFDWTRVADFYRQRIVPYTLGALAMYLASRYIPAAPLGPYADLVGEAMFSLAWLFLVAAIVADLVDALKAMGYPVPGKEPPNG
jgi:hypothetical protein